MPPAQDGGSPSSMSGERGTGSGTGEDPATAHASPPTPVLPDGAPRTVVGDLRAPWSVTFLGDGTPLVSQRDDGRILEVLEGGGTRLVGTVPGVRHGGEGGLLGLAVDAQSRLHVYSTAQGGNRVQSFALAGGPGSLGRGGARTVIEGLPAGRTHNGGRIAFGPDGMLYVTVGDAGRREDAQDLTSLAGKILRLTPEGGVPADNPFPGSPVLSLGHRNPQGLAWAADGTLFSAEFGQATWDELNVITPGANHGWPVVEGAGGDPRFVDPVRQWATSEASPSGIAVVGGTLFVANLRGAVLRAVPVASVLPGTTRGAGAGSAPTTGAGTTGAGTTGAGTTGGTVSEHFAGEFGRLRDVVAAPGGELWILTNNTDGRGSPREGDDRLLAVTVVAADG